MRATVDAVPQTVVQRAGREFHLIARSVPVCGVKQSMPLDPTPTNTAKLEPGGQTGKQTFHLRNPHKDKRKEKKDHSSFVVTAWVS